MALLLVLGVMQTGYASQYAPFVMNHPVKLHQLGNYDDGRYVAVADCGKIGDKVLLRHGGPWEVHTVADCAGADAYEGDGFWMRDNNILVEISHETAVRWGVVGKGGVAVQCIGC